MQIAKIVHISLFMICFSISSTTNAKQDAVTPEKTSDITSTSISPKLPFSISLERLEKNITADEAQWIDVGENKHLLLTRRTNGRKERGNVLLLHAQGENADHLRLIQPLSRQLSKLGWNLFIPSIALENFPPLPVVQNIENSDSADKDLEDDNLESNSLEGNSLESNDSSLLDNKNYYFKNSQAYQDYFGSLCQAIYDQTEIFKQPFIIIANQNAAYWSLSCLNQENKSTPMIFLQPQLPIGVENNLAELFAKQTHPIFSFHIKNSSADPYSNAFKKRVWRSGYQRFNIGMLKTTKLQTENTVIARTITGWVDKQRKK